MPADDYSVECFLGSGSFGEVFKGVHIATNAVYALKMVNLEEADDMTRVIKEVHFLSHNRSQYLIKHYETFLRGSDMWIVMEYCGGGSCADLLKCLDKVSEQVAAYILRDVLKALDYLHHRKKVHRDVKLANILLTETGEVKLGDFGVSSELSVTRAKRNTLVGTPYWMAPEVISRSSQGYDVKADIWSTGITAIELVTGTPPLAQYPPIKALFEIPKRKPPQLEGDYSDRLKNFIKYCLVKLPKQRPSASTLLHHEFITTCPEVSLVEVLMEKKKKESDEPSRLPKRKKGIERNVPVIEWNLSSFQDGTQSLPPSWQGKYSELIYDSLTNVIGRAQSEVTREMVRHVRRCIVNTEEENPGFCHALVEELTKLVGETPVDSAIDV